MLKLPGIASRNSSSESDVINPPLSSKVDLDSDIYPTLLQAPPALRSTPADLCSSSDVGACSATTDVSSRSAPVPLGRDDFEVVRLLGAGAFGEVKLVRCRTDDQLYAMKVIEKMTIHERQNLKDSKAADRAQAERDIGVEARQWRCPFIINLNAAFQTNEKLYYIFEHCPGGDLRDLLDDQPQRRFKEAAARFYLAEVTFALAHLHRQDTIHRDVKLENVLIDAEGHVRLADFGFAKSCSEDARCSGFVGEADVLMPPELLRGEDYGKDFDCWQLGILAFVMLTGRLPVRGGKAWPGALPRGTTTAAGNLCRELLREVRVDRLGYSEGAGCVSSHPFFACLDWNAVECKVLEPPFQGTLRQGLPMRNTVKASGIRDLLTFRNFSFVRKSIFGSSRSRSKKV